MQKPKPGEIVKKKTIFGDYNRLKVVPDSEWQSHFSEVRESHFVTKTMNRLGIMEKHSMGNVELVDGTYYIDDIED